MEEKNRPLEEIKRLRVDGRFNDAFVLLSDVLKNDKVSSADLVEAVRLAILLEQHEVAYDLYLALKRFPDFRGETEIEILLRLKLLLKDKPVPELQSMDFQKGVKWCQSYNVKNEDPVYLVKIQDCVIDCHDGTINYAFRCLCLSCEVVYAVSIRRSLIVSREFFCSNCLARQTIDYALIKNFFKNNPRFSEDLESDNYNSHVLSLKKKLNSDSVEENRFPLLCQYMNIDYTYHLVQLFLKRKFSKVT